MNGEIQIKTGEFEYINLAIKAKDNADAVEQFKALREAWRAPTNGLGLESKEWNAVVDAVLIGKLTLTPELWEAMNQRQQWFLQEIKKSKNRN